VNAAVLDRTIVQDLLDQFDGDKSFIRDLLSIYVAQGIEQLANLRSAFRLGDGHLLGRVAHALAGASLNMGAFRVADACRVVERKASAGEAVAEDDIAVIAENFDVVLEESARFQTGG
jgi:HPt (histidine-containing phosphotransfer) domain-containing protein